MRLQEHLANRCYSRVVISPTPTSSLLCQPNVDTQMTMTKKEFAPVTPGEMLKEEFLAEYGLSQKRLASHQTVLPRSSIIVDALRQTPHSGLAFTLVIA